MWKKNVIKHKIMVCCKVLEDKLFFLNPIMRETLINVRKQTYDMQENLRFIGWDNQQSVLFQEQTFTLEGFKTMQENYRKKITERIRQYSRESRKIV